MKRHGNLYPAICDWRNLWLAARKAQRGKRARPNVARFNFALEGELTTLRDELLDQTYAPGAYREFWIHEPKPRLISAAPYRDRVVHHALCNVIEPIFERTFIFDTYACRKNKGTHAAVRRLQEWMKVYPYALQCDIRQYFPSIDHEILWDAICRKIKCRATLRLIQTIIMHSNEQGAEASYFAGDDLLSPFERRCGLPIGNQTSQFFANIYLSGFDHWLTQRPDMKYLRYVDDFIILGMDKKRLHELKAEIQNHLAGLRLQLHPTKCQVARAQDGLTFLGFRIFPQRLRLRADNPHRYGRRLKQLAQKYSDREVESADVTRSVMAWIGHAAHADTLRLRADVLGAVVFCRG
jgi:retron-type reverse transcriptase